MRDVVVIGAPVGGGAAIARLISELPSDLNAAVFIVLHATLESPILLADVLNAPGRIRAADALDGEPIQRRRIYVAVTGNHLLVQRDKVRLSPNTESKPHRPSIDVLFTSAAAAYKGRVLGVLLLHAREDGLLGLDAIRQAGGRTITQHNEYMPEPPKHPATAELLSDDHIELKKIPARVLAYVSGVNGHD